MKINESELQSRKPDMIKKIIEDDFKGAVEKD